MSKWRAEFIRLFPEYRYGVGSFQRSDMSIYMIYFDLWRELDDRIEGEDWDWLGRVIEHVKWCFSQRKRAVNIWNAAATAFLEHMADSDERANLIPEYVHPPMFEDMKDEFLKRRERKGAGKAQQLLDAYNAYHGTDFQA